MRLKACLCGATALLGCLALGAVHAQDGSGAREAWRFPVPTGKSVAVHPLTDRQLAKLVPGKSTKAQVARWLGAPWRVVQFNDCGASMPGQADETWDYRGHDASGASYRIHIEFDEHDVAALVAKIPDEVQGGKGTPAKTAAGDPMKGMPMSAKRMAM